MRVGSCLLEGSVLPQVRSDGACAEPVAVPLPALVTISPLRVAGDVFRKRTALAECPPRVAPFQAKGTRVSPCFLKRAVPPHLAPFATRPDSVPIPLPTLVSIRP